MRVDPTGIDKHELDEELCRRIRASFLLAGPAARAPRPRRRAAAGRRRDRPPPARPAHPRARRARRRDRDQRPLRHARPAAARHADLPRRGERDGDRERDHGRRARRGRDRDRQRGLRAARPGSLPLPRHARRRDRGHRLERAAHPGRRRELRRRRARASRPEHIEVGELHRPRRGDRRRHHDRGRRARGTSSRSCPRSRGSACTSRWASTTVRVPPGQRARDPGRPRRPDPEDRGRPVARLPRRPDVDRGRDRRRRRAAPC